VNVARPFRARWTGDSNGGFRFWLP
jgi:hypothetical protein